MGRLIAGAVGVLAWIAAFGIATTDGCNGVDFGGTKNNASWACVSQGGDVSQPVAVVGLFVLGLVGLLVAVWPRDRF